MHDKTANPQKFTKLTFLEIGDLDLSDLNIWNNADRDRALRDLSATILDSNGIFSW